MRTSPLFAKKDSGLKFNPEINFIPSRKNNPQAKMRELSPNFAAGYQFIAEHLDELLSHGWTRPELFRRNKSQGIAWLPHWTDNQVLAVMGTSGQIIFKLKRHHGPVVQTAWPRVKIFN